jgi:hypothetical protein
MIRIPRLCFAVALSAVSVPALAVFQLTKTIEDGFRTGPGFTKSIDETRGSCISCCRTPV